MSTSEGPGSRAKPDANWCATWSRENAECPAGTAVAVERFVLVELPLPWPAEIEKHELLNGVAALPGTRIQAIRGVQAGGYRHSVVCYWRRDGEWFSSYARSEREVARPDLPRVVGELLRGEGLEECASTRTVRDLLLCTHGTRDRCCAKLGGALYRELSEKLPDRVRLWRTSHTGGHRFAPTGISFPEGLMWAGLDVEVALGVVQRGLSVDRAVRHLRGCTGLGGALQQAADGEAFARRGWSWWDCERKASVGTDDGERASVDLEFRHGTERGKLVATIERGRTLPIALCGEPIDAAVKNTTELVVSRLA